MNNQKIKWLYIQHEDVLIIVIYCLYILLSFYNFFFLFLCKNFVLSNIIDCEIKRKIITNNRKGQICKKLILRFFICRINQSQGLLVFQIKGRNE